MPIHDNDIFIAVHQFGSGKNDSDIRLEWRRAGAPDDEDSYFETCAQFTGDLIRHNRSGNGIPPHLRKVQDVVATCDL